MEFIIKGYTKAGTEKYMFHIEEVHPEEYELKIFLWNTLPAILTYNDSHISSMLSYVKGYYNGVIRFNWETIRYLNEQPVAIRDLVEIHKFLLM